ncbi:hypothetical protein [Paenibacillus sp. L3-i20]|uniref:hypothetical protein n=1 Tax=Paenibacillus sp. L3-i20 TaxID=2905833 RepID=UPI001EE05174|nr:hypothetical protein [Paenibacillus sp. L3-i20]GKU76846.1 hypothetical protein L3i20_v212430 [Paenibacillus sp. L3-i20]
MTKAIASDTSLDKEVLTIGDILAKQDKVKVKLYLPPEARQKLEALESAGKDVLWPCETVSINGYTYQIQLGKEVEVPESVAEVLRHANMI